VKLGNVGLRQRSAERSSGIAVGGEVKQGLSVSRQS